MRKIICMSCILLISIATLAQREQDSLALVALYLSTNGINWENNTNWVSSKPISTWYGVYCKNDRVSTINLPENNLSGKIPSEIGKLTNLERLDLSNSEYYVSSHDNQVTGNIPTEIGNLTFLSWLDLSNNQLTGPIPDEINNLDSLKEFNLSNNRISGSIPNAIGDLKKLRILNLSINHIQGFIPTDIGNLEYLNSLDLSYNQISGTFPEEICNIDKLRYLNLSNNQIAGSIPDAIDDLKNLYYIDLSYNHFSGLIPKEIGNLEELMRLYLSHNQLTGLIPNEFVILLKHYNMSIDLSFNQLSGFFPIIEGAGHIFDLHCWYLDLSHNQITGNIPKEIGYRWHLNHLDLSHNQITGNIPKEIGYYWYNLDHLDLSHNQLTGKIPRKIGNLKGLILNLCGNQLEGHIPLKVRRLEPNLIVDNKRNNFGMIEDIDGNLYWISKIGKQVWMKQNLQTTKLNDGTSIPFVTDNTVWQNLTTSGYCWYRNSEVYGRGALYNWYTVNTGKLCPDGWHVPTDSDWKILERFLGESSVAGGKLKGVYHFYGDHTLFYSTPDFNASSAGFRHGGDENSHSGSFCTSAEWESRFWISNTEDMNTGWYRCIDGSSVFRQGKYPKQGGFSIRCIKDYKIN